MASELFVVCGSTHGVFERTAITSAIDDFSKSVSRKAGRAAYQSTINRGWMRDLLRRLADCQS